MNLKICRGCLKIEADEKFISVFEENGKAAKNIFELTKLVVFEISDESTACICHECLDELNEACDFRSKLIRNHKRFLEIYSTDKIRIKIDKHLKNDENPRKRRKLEENEVKEEVLDEKISLEKSKNSNLEKISEEFEDSTAVLNSQSSTGPSDFFIISEVKSEAGEFLVKEEKHLKTEKFDIETLKIGKSSENQKSNQNQEFQLQSTDSEIFLQSSDSLKCLDSFDDQNLTRSNTDYRNFTKNLSNFAKKSTTVGRTSTGLISATSSFKQIPSTAISSSSKNNPEILLVNHQRIKIEPELQLNDQKPRLGPKGIVQCVNNITQEEFDSNHLPLDSYNDYTQLTQDQLQLQPSFIKSEFDHQEDQPEFTQGQLPLFDLEDQTLLMNETQTSGFVQENQQKRTRIQTKSKNYQEDSRSPNSDSDPALTTEFNFPSTFAGFQATGNFSCNLCSKTFNKKCHLTQHIKITHQNSHHQFKCETCGKKFKDDETLKKHEVKHREVKPWKCGICTKTFCHKADMKRHELNHSMDKPFVCDICGHGFIRNDHLLKHKISHVKKNHHLLRMK